MKFNVSKGNFKITKKFSKIKNKKMKLNLKFYKLILLMLLVSSISSAQQNTNGWFWANGRAQSNNLNWVRIIDPTHYYAVGDNGTFMKSSDGGESWIINSQAGIPDNSFGAGASHRLNTAWFFDANTGIVAGQSAYNENIKIRRTTNGGESFSTIDLGASTGSPRVYDIHFINSTTGFLCGSANVKAFKTTNAGLNWTAMSNFPATAYNFNCIYAVNENNIIIGIESSGLYRNILRTTNGGASWIDQTLPGSVIVDFKDIVFQNANTGFICGNSVATNPSYFASTTDGGVSWIESVFPNKEHGLYDLRFKGAKVYALGASFTSYFTSSDLGVTWDSVYFNDLSNVDQPFLWFVFAFDINSNNEIVVGMNGKVNVSYDGGNTWRNKNYAVGKNDVNFQSVFAQPGTNNVWAGGGAGRIVRSTNGGNNWSLTQTTNSFAYYQIEMLNSQTGYAVGGDLYSGVGYCVKTTNGGVTWENKSITTPNTPIYGLDFINTNTGWIFGGYPFGSPGVIAKTTNGGATWIDQPIPGVTNVISNGQFADANTGYCYSGSNFWKSTNGGTNWNLVSTKPPGIFKSLQVFSGNNIFLANSRTIYKSSNGGVTWDSVSVPATEDVIFNMNWIDFSDGTVVGTQGYTAKTRDGGLTWTERNTGTSSLWKVSMANKDTVYTSCAINVYGAIFRLYDVSTTTSLNLTVGLQGFRNGAAQISDSVKCHLRNSVSPFNEIEVSSAVLNTAGEAVFTFNSAPSGSYYLEITHRNSIETWSASPVSITTGGSVSYNFTTAASQAYGNNLILKDGKYCDYGGDVNQNGLVDLTDVVIINNAATVFTTGYVVQDVNGDNLVDLSDLILALNNSTMFVTSVTP